MGDIPIIGQAQDDEEPYSGIKPAADPDATEPAADPNCLTAFIVVVGLDGSTSGQSDLGLVGELVPVREAELSDMRRHASEIVHDINAMHTAQQTAAILQQSAMHMAEQQRVARLQQKLSEKGLRTK